MQVVGNGNGSQMVPLTVDRMTVWTNPVGSEERDGEREAVAGQCVELTEDLDLDHRGGAVGHLRGHRVGTPQMQRRPPGRRR